MQINIFFECEFNPPPSSCALIALIFRATFCIDLNVHHSNFLFIFHLPRCTNSICPLSPGGLLQKEDIHPAIDELLHVLVPYAKLFLCVFQRRSAASPLALHQTDAKPHTYHLCVHVFFFFLFFFFVRTCA